MHRNNPFIVGDSSPIMELYRMSRSKSRESSRHLRETQANNYKDYRTKKICQALQRNHIIDREYGHLKSKIIQSRQMETKLYGVEIHRYSPVSRMEASTKNHQIQGYMANLVPQNKDQLQKRKSIKHKNQPERKNIDKVRNKERSPQRSPQRSPEQSPQRSPIRKSKKKTQLCQRISGRSSENLQTLINLNEVRRKFSKKKTIWPDFDEDSMDQIEEPKEISPYDSVTNIHREKSKKLSSFAPFSEKISEKEESHLLGVQGQQGKQQIQRKCSIFGNTTESVDSPSSSSAKQMPQSTHVFLHRITNEYFPDSKNRKKSNKCTKRSSFESRPSNNELIQI